MRPTRRRAPTLAPAALLAALLAPLACNAGTQNALVTQPVIDLGDALTDVRQEHSALQEQSDSLRTQLSRPDGVLRRIGNVVGAPMP